MTTNTAGTGFRFAAAALLALVLAGCASTPDTDQAFHQMPAEHGRNLARNSDQKAAQCAPYARAHSGVKLFGDASTWWAQAAGKYDRGASPAAGAVIVLTNYSGSSHGHVAVVRRVMSPREIRVDHANWLNDGSIYINNPVVDVSSDNDWSQVRVWNIQNASWGVKVFAVQGFISPGGGRHDLVARADTRPADIKPATPDRTRKAPRGATAPPDSSGHESPPEDLN